MKHIAEMKHLAAIAALLALGLAACQKEGGPPVPETMAPEPAAPTAPEATPPAPMTGESGNAPAAPAPGAQ